MHFLSYNALTMHDHSILSNLEEQTIMEGNECQPEGGYEPIDMDVTEEEDNVIKGCYFLELNIDNRVSTSGYTNIYEYMMVSSLVTKMLPCRHQPPSLQDNQELVGPDVLLYYRSSSLDALYVQGKVCGSTMLYINVLPERSWSLCHMVPQ